MPQSQLHTLARDTPDAPIRVLVIDDDTNLRDLLKQALTRAGFSVMTAREGSEGLQVLLSKHIDVVVSDLMMEPMDGITFLTEALKIWPWLGVIVFSGFIREDLFQKARELGISVILAKPVPLDVLTSNIMDEAHRMHTRVGGQGDLTLSRMLYQLTILRDIARTAIDAPNMEQALQNLCHNLGTALPSTLTTIMSQTAEQHVPFFAASLQRAVPPSFLSTIEDIIRERFRILSGTALPDGASWALTGLKPEQDARAPQAEPLCFPIISAHGISGILLFLPPDDFSCTESDVSFLYHAANHFNTVLNAFYRIRELAIRDELTGLYNRHHLQNELPGIWAMADRYGLNPAFLILDVDHFKHINDNYGHAAGDQAMRTLANIVRQTSRSSDLIARYGGDEITIVLPDADPARVGQFMERIQHAIADHLFSTESYAFHCTVSIGAASCRGTDGQMCSSEDVLTHADEALYTAKRNGRDRSVVWAPIDNNTITGSNHQHSPPPLRTKTPSIIVVDDDPTVLDIITLQLEAAKMSVLAFDSGANALQAIDSDPHGFDLALIDLNLGDINGLELVQRIKEKRPFLVSIIITGDATLDNAVNSLRHGVYDFIQKPWKKDQLLMILDRALEYHGLRMENAEYQHNLEAMVKQKSQDLTKALKRTRDAFDFTLRAMTAMLDAREQTTGAHSARVQKLTLLMLRKYPFKEKEIDAIRQGALLHDIGKIAVPDHILLKAGPLTAAEWTIMQEHVHIGYELIKSNPDLQDAADIILCHHEKFDGTGYPRGLQGEEIPLGARIFSVVDAYDAMRSTRPYRVGMPAPQAIAELQKHCGTQFDPNVVRGFLKNIDEIETAGKWN